jgi:hypothetical protein
MEDKKKKSFILKAPPSTFHEQNEWARMALGWHTEISQLAFYRGFANSSFVSLFFPHVICPNIILFHLITLIPRNFI